MDEQTGAIVNSENSGENQIANDPRDNRHRGGGSRNRQRGGQPRPQQQSNQSLKNALNMSELRELAELINQHGFTDFEFENENIRVRLRKELAPQIIQGNFQPQTTVSPNSAAQTTQTAPTTMTAETTATAEIDEDAGLRKILSPIVGTFYRAPSPEAAPFVTNGDSVSAETIVCIVEAMKLMNEIPAEISGEIAKIYVENGQPVEYGQPLFAVK